MAHRESPEIVMLSAATDFGGQLYSFNEEVRLKSHRGKNDAWLRRY